MLLQLCACLYKSGVDSLHLSVPILPPDGVDLGTLEDGHRLFKVWHWVLKETTEKNLSST